MTDENVVATAAPVRTTPRAGGIVVVAISAALWWPAFTLGAWGTLFFDQTLTVWAASTAAFFIVLLQPRPYRPRVYQAVVLFLPSVWLVLTLIHPDVGDVYSLVVDLLALAVALVGVPFTLVTLVRIVWPDFGADLSRTRRFLSLVAVIVLVGIAFLLGVNENRFLTCEDFALSGNSQPQGCVHEPK